MPDILEAIKARDPHEREFHQAVIEVLESVKPVLDQNPQYRQAAVLDRIVEPERIVTFRIPWLDDEGRVIVNRGFCVEMSSAIGPYKSGLRFHPSVNQSILKFLAFEQVFKNALTTLPLGGAQAAPTSIPKESLTMKRCGFVRIL
jgi:glutamate dehydrogenase (NADP+)